MILSDLESFFFIFYRQPLFLGVAFLLVAAMFLGVMTVIRAGVEA